jgi:hypothetical protein
MGGAPAIPIKSFREVDGFREELNPSELTPLGYKEFLLYLTGIRK